MRGRSQQSLSCSPATRLTPAHAGKIPILQLEPAVYRAHPRVCGENSRTADGASVCPGSPPRMRGLSQAGLTSCRGLRLTPAHAGKTRQASNSVCIVVFKPFLALGMLITFFGKTQFPCCNSIVSFLRLLRIHSSYLHPG